MPEGISPSDKRKLFVEKQKKNEAPKKRGRKSKSSQ